MRLFNNKTNTKLKINKTEEKQEIKVSPKPKICCVDIDSETFKALADSGYSLYNGTLGGIMKNIPNKRSDDYYHFLLDCDFPDNFHEYDILILDLTNEAHKEFNPIIIGERQTKAQKIHSLICSYPTTIFDPRPLSSSRLGKRIREVKNRKFIQIIFASKQYEVEYEVVQITGNSTQRHPNEKHQLYDFNYLPLASPRSGKEASILNIRQDIFQLLNKHLNDLTYEQTFHHPTVWDNQENKHVLSKNIVTLMKNINDEVISLVKFEDNFVTFIFPNFKNKKDFIIEFTKNILPSIFPEVFPFSTQFKWLENSEYHLPNHKDLLTEREFIKEEFNKSILAVEHKIEENAKNFNFLHAILTETGEKLVSAVFSFLKWLEFKNVVIKDEQSVNIKEEDIQVELDSGILVIEVKGIGGTSTDSECSQVSKIKHRREKERKSFDVFALYIVNHQRYLPPLSRTNPPFQEQQIADAIDDERGLLSTWQLFNLYQEVNEGLISKAEARSQITQFGHIKFKPKFSENVGQPKEILNGGYVVILDLVNTKIKINDFIVIEKAGKYFRAKILSLQLDGKDVQKVSNGEVGIKFDKKIPRNSVLWTQ